MFESEIKQSFKIIGHIKATWRDAETGKILRTDEKDNIVVTVGRAVIAQRLASDNTYTLNINYGALGTSTTAPANGDTILGTEVFRKLKASATDLANVAYLSFFYSATDCNGTYREFGTFIDGTAGADTGQLFTHVAVNWVKANTETLTIDVTYTIV